MGMTKDEGLAGMREVAQTRLGFRARARKASAFRIPSAHHLRLGLNLEILNVAWLRLRFPSIAQTKSGAHLGA